MLVLPFVPEEAELEIRDSFDRAGRARRLGPDAQETADLWFFRTVVRLHRAGEGAPYTGLKPAGLGTGPVIPLAEQALRDHSVDQLSDFLVAALREELEGRLEAVEHLSRHQHDSLGAARQYVEAILGFQVYSHHLHEAIKGRPHESAN